MATGDYPTHIDALHKANQKYRELRQSTQEFAIAAHQHPEVAYDIEQSPELNPEEIGNMTETQAKAGMMALTPILSKKWGEAQQVFMMELENTFQRKNNSEEIDQTEIEAYQDLRQEYDKLENELKKIEQAATQILEETPADPAQEEYILEAKTVL